MAFVLAKFIWDGESCFNFEKKKQKKNKAKLV